MKKLLLLLIIPFLSFGQICEDPNSCTYLSSYFCGNNICAYPGDMCDNPNFFYDDDCNCSMVFSIVCEDINACNYLDTLSGYFLYEVISEAILENLDDGPCNITSVEPCLYDDDCNEIEIDEQKTLENPTKVINLLGKKTTNKGFQLHIYNDGSVEKKYLIK